MHLQILTALDNEIARLIQARALLTGSEGIKPAPQTETIERRGIVSGLQTHSGSDGRRPTRSRRNKQSGEQMNWNIFVVNSLHLLKAQRSL